MFDVFNTYSRCNFDSICLWTGSFIESKLNATQTRISLNVWMSNQLCFINCVKTIWPEFIRLHTLGRAKMWRHVRHMSDIVYVVCRSCQIDEIISSLNETISISIAIAGFQNHLTIVIGPFPSQQLAMKRWSDDYDGKRCHRFKL